MYFTDDYKIIKERINHLSNELTRMEKSLKGELPVLPCYNRTPLILKVNYSSKNKKTMFDPVVDIAMFTASPLVKYKKDEIVSTKFQEINYISELNRIKKPL